MGLFNGYGPDNLVWLSGKTQRITSSVVGDPTVTVIKATDDTYRVQTETWYKVICVSACRFAYVGMTKDAAERCGDAMRSAFTRTSPIYSYEATVDQETHTVRFQWVQKDQEGSVLDSDISVEHVDGTMYQVVVTCNCTDLKFSTQPTVVQFPYPECILNIPTYQG